MNQDVIIKEELHDPDYHDQDNVQDNHHHQSTQLDKDDKVKRITNIINEQFDQDISQKERHLELIEETLLNAKKLFQKLRYGIVHTYYNSKHLHLPGDEIQSQIADQQHPCDKAKVYSILTNKDKPLHPEAKRLLSESLDFNSLSPYTIRPPRKRSKNQNEKSDIKLSVSNIKNEPSTSSNHSSESSKSEEIDSQKKVPRYIKPKDLDKNVLKVDPASRNKQKEKFRIIIGNTSKYIGAQSESDKSTHRWLLYIRGPREKPDISHFVTSVTVQLHDSYAPHNIIHISSPPFHLIRRGWGEFPVKMKVHFKNKTLNKPVSLVHQLKLDRLYTGVQTLGCETVVDVWLYTDETMIEKISPSKLKSLEEVKSSPKKIVNDVKIKSEFNQPKTSTVKRKLLENSTVKENGILQHPKKTTSISKSNKIVSLSNGHILTAFQNDHCYTRSAPVGLSNGFDTYKEMGLLEQLQNDVAKCSDVKLAVEMMLKKLPIVDEKYKAESLCKFPIFTVPSVENYFSYNIYKRRNIEWTRAKTIADILKSNSHLNQWSAKQIIIFSHYHGYFPVMNEERSSTAGKRYRHDVGEDAFENSEQINTKTKFEITQQPKTEHHGRIDSISSNEESDSELDIVTQVDLKPKVMFESVSEPALNELETLPFSDDDEKLRCYFVEHACANIGIHLRNEDIGDGYAFSLSHKVILAATKCLIEDILRRSLAIKLRTEVTPKPENEDGESIQQNIIKSCIWDKVESGKPHPISTKHIFEAIKSKPEFDFLTNLDLGADAIEYKGSL